MKNFKDVLAGTFGAVGIILWYLMTGVVLFLPLSFLGFPFWISFVIILVILYVPFIGELTQFVLWIWSFVVVSEHIDGWSIFYFVAFAFYFFTTILPFVTNIIITLIASLIEMLNNKRD